MANNLYRVIALENKRRRIVREHYELSRPVTRQELKDEIANLRRKQAAGNLDTRQEHLAAALDI